MVRRHTALAAAAFALVACRSDPGPEGASCTKKEECAEGLSCVDNKCAKLDGAAQNEGEGPTGYCGQLAALAGEWVFDTTVVGAKRLGSKGINGHYTLAVTVEGCEGRVHVTKTGYDKVKYKDAKIQRADADLAQSEKISESASATVALKAGKPSHEFHFVVRDGELFGYYEQVEKSFKGTGMWGDLRGVRRDGTLDGVEEHAAQPCEVQCMLACDVPRRAADESLDSAGLSACKTACGSGEAPEKFTCGEDKTIDGFKLTMTGPLETLDAVCGDALAEIIKTEGLNGGIQGECERKFLVGEKQREAKLSGRKLGEPWKGAQVLRVGVTDTGYVGGLVLALETADGWYRSNEFADLDESGVGGNHVELKGVEMRARDFLPGEANELSAQVTVIHADADMGVNEFSEFTSTEVVICEAGSPPVCAAIPIEWSDKRAILDKGLEGDANKHDNLYKNRGQLYLSILPGGRLSISAAKDARDGDRQLIGFYAWP